MMSEAKKANRSARDFRLKHQDERPSHMDPPDTLERRSQRLVVKGIL
jgi:hypothetical protein